MLSHFSFLTQSLNIDIVLTFFFFFFFQQKVCRLIPMLFIACMINFKIISISNTLWLLRFAVLLDKTSKQVTTSGKASLQFLFLSLACYYFRISLEICRLAPMLCFYFSFCQRHRVPISSFYNYELER